MDMPDPTDAALYDHWVHSPVRFSDTDLVGHVNNVALAAHVEAGRVAYASSLTGALRQDDRWITLRRLEIDYLREVFYPADLQVGSRLVAVGRTSLTVASGVFDGGDCVALGKGVLVLVGPQGASPIEGATREQLEAELPAAR